MSRKLTVWLLRSAVIFSSKSLKIACNYFLDLSANFRRCWALISDRHHDRARRCLCQTFQTGWFKINSPTSSHTSTPSWLPIVTSNRESLFFFTYILLP